jgi:acylphosphatase
MGQPPGIARARVIRRTTHFGGNVQGVGFRYTAQGLARGFKVVGYVRNLPDGRVELVAEGDEREITGLLEAIGQQMGHFIKKRTDEDSPPSGEFADFSVRP